MASNYLRRIERIEDGNTVRFPWEVVCSRCAAEGRTTTPEERCEASRCDSCVTLEPEHAEAVRDAFRQDCISKGQNPDEEEAKIMREIEAQRQAWEATKAAMREACQ